MENSQSPPTRRALLSVSNKSQIISFARRLHHLGYEIISTGGTAQKLLEAQVPVTQIADFTGFPEILDGRVKTLHPKVHAGLLARTQDQALMESLEFVYIDIVAVNLYPFQQVTALPDCDQATAIENIDIGGPTLIRAAAKNFQRVTVVTDVQDYDSVIDAIEKGHVSESTRKQLAQKAFQHCSDYDLAISQYLQPEQSWPPRYDPRYELAQVLRYGENPHQEAALYRESQRSDSIVNAKQIQGKALSYNNIADADAALRICQEFKDEAACVIVKHANPCGVALGKTLQIAYERAFATDPSSSFGGIIIFNQLVDEALIQAILQKQFVELILAPEFSKAAINALQQKPNIRALTVQLHRQTSQWESTRILGGLLCQTNPHLTTEFTCVTKQSVDSEVLAECDFAWSIVKHVKSNAIVISQERQTVGIGAGQASRVFSTEIAIMKAKENQLPCHGAILASDAFFPFADSIELAAKAGIKAIVQPGGSIRDEEVIDAANQFQIAMLFTGQRYFSH